MPGPFVIAKHFYHGKEGFGRNRSNHISKVTQITLRSYFESFKHSFHNPELGNSFFVCNVFPYTSCLRHIEYASQIIRSILLFVKYIYQ